MEYKCEFCNRKTKNSRDSFADINWIAFQINNEETICACYEHHQLLIDLVKGRFKTKDKGEKCQLKQGGRND